MNKKNISIILLFISIIFALGSGVLLTSTSEQLDKTKANIVKLNKKIIAQKKEKNSKSQSYTEADLNKNTYKGDNLLELDKEEQKLKYKKDIYSTTEKELRTLIEHYINIRYNYKNIRERDNIPNKINNIITNEFNKVLSKRLKEKWTTENAGVGSGTNQQTQIISIAFDDIKQAGSADDLNGRKNYKVSFGKTAIVKLKINNIFYGYSYIQLNSSIDERNWKISDEEIMALSFEEG